MRTKRIIQQPMRWKRFSQPDAADVVVSGTKMSLGYDHWESCALFLNVFSAIRLNGLVKEET